MIAVRWSAGFVIVACLIGLGFTRTYNGLFVIGVLASAVLLWTFGVFSPGFWVGVEPSSRSRLDDMDSGCPVDHSWDQEDEEDCAA
ncbi:hypothetical protein [Microbacterium gilvum]|uniref:hypothetical protein n=1 Tax=Microbacterium gilvum TaxID=1336204 RepID=UPI0031EDE4B4